MPPCCPDTAFEFYRKCILKWDTFLPTRGWFLSHDVSRTSKQLVQIENKCGWIDGWSQNPEYLQSTRVIILVVIHLDLLPPSICTQSLRSVVNYDHYSPGGDRSDRQTENLTNGSQWKAPIWIYYLCSCAGHFTAVFTLDPAMSIRWHCPGLEMWLPMHPPPPSPQTPPSPLPFFSLFLKKSQQALSSKTVIHNSKPQLYLQGNWCWCYNSSPN